MTSISSLNSISVFNQCIIFSVFNEIILTTSLSLLKAEHKKVSKICQLTFYAIMFGQGTFFFIKKLFSRGKREFYLLYYNAIFKDRVLFK